MLVARTGPTARADLLLVHGFDRFDRFVKEPDNRRNQLALHADAIARIADFALGFDSASNEAVIAGRVALAGYRAVDWALGEESTVHETLSATEQALLAAFLAAGGRAFVTGAEIGWDLDLNGSAADRAFYRGPLAAQYVNDDAGTYAFGPAPGSVFAGLPGGTFDNGSGGTYDVDYPDTMVPSGAGARASLVYPGGGPTAAVEQDTGGARVLNWGFPFETIVNASLRAQYMDRAVDFLTAPRALQGPRVVTLGGQARFDVRLPARAGQLYLLGAAGGNQPGLPLGGGRTLALAVDPLFLLSFASPSGVFAGFVGFLDAQGAGAGFVNMPNLPELRGLQIYVSGLVLDAGLINVDDVLPLVPVVGAVATAPCAARRPTASDR